MKMEHTISAPRKGVVKAFRYAPRRPGGRRRRAGRLRRSRMMERVRIVEVGPRDGLQNEKQIVPTADQARADRAAGCRRACATSRPRRSSRRSGCRRWPTTPRSCAACKRRAGRQLSGADAQPQGLRGGGRGRRHRGGGVRGGVRRRSRRRTSTARSPSRSIASCRCSRRPGGAA